VLVLEVGNGIPMSYARSILGFALSSRITSCEPHFTKRCIHALSLGYPYT
jgi:hypothetical protein